MSVHTPIATEQLVLLLAQYDIGDCLNYQAIEAGVTNTNYFLSTGQGHYLLTLFEELTPSELDPFLNTLHALHECGFSCSQIMRTRQQQQQTVLYDKPCIISAWITGKTLSEPTAQHCQQIGEKLAQLHNLGQVLTTAYPDNTRNHAWRTRTFEQLQDKLSHDDMLLLKEEIAFHHQAWPLPQGLCHNDLFRDNAIFDGDSLTGIIDFYYCCKNYYLYDLAIVAFDWCSQTNSQLDPQRLDALWQGYQQHRPLQAVEHDHWQSMLRRACLRFYLSRLYDWHVVADDPLVQKKDPDWPKQCLLYHRQL